MLYSYIFQNSYQLPSTQLIYYVVDVCSMISDNNFYLGHPIVLYILQDSYQLLSTQFIIIN